MPDVLVGWKKDPYDQRDYIHPLKALPVPDAFDLSNLLPPVRHQLYVGSCVGFGIGANLCTVAKAQTKFAEWFSPTWIYNGARFIEGTLDKDAGCYPRDAFSWLAKNGSLLEHFWAYNGNELDKSPPSSLRMSQAYKAPDFTYVRVVDGVEGICAAIASGHTVSIGTYWFTKWMKPPASGVLPEPTKADPVSGGHATLLYGYNKTAGMVYGQNSWGTEWGNNGKFAMPMSSFELFKFYGGYDAHYITFTAAPAPPVPPKKKCWLLNLFKKGG